MQNWFADALGCQQTDKFWARHALPSGGLAPCPTNTGHKHKGTQRTQRSLAHGVMWSWGRGTAASPAELQTPHAGSGFMFRAGGQDRFSPANCRGRGRSSRLTTDRRPPREGANALARSQEKTKTGQPGREMDRSGSQNVFEAITKPILWCLDRQICKTEKRVDVFWSYCWISTGWVHPSLFKMKPVLCLNGMFVFVVMDPAKKGEYQESW